MKDLAFNCVSKAVRDQIVELLVLDLLREQKDTNNGLVDRLYKKTGGRIYYNIFRLRPITARLERTQLIAVEKSDARADQKIYYVKHEAALEQIEDRIRVYQTYSHMLRPVATNNTACMTAKFKEEAFDKQAFKELAKKYINVKIYANFGNNTLVLVGDAFEIDDLITTNKNVLRTECYGAI